MTVIKVGELDPEMVACVEKNDADGLKALFRQKEEERHDPVRLQKKVDEVLASLREHLIGYREPDQEGIDKLRHWAVEDYWTLNQENEKHESLVYFACKRQGRVNALRAIMEHPKFEINARIGFVGHTALRTALQNGSHDAAWALLSDPRVDANIQDYSRVSPLEYTRYSNNVPGMKLLIASGRKLDPLPPKSQNYLPFYEVPETEADRLYDEFSKDPEGTRAKVKLELGL